MYPRVYQELTLVTRSYSELMAYGKECFKSMLTVLKGAIPKWERSGQGEGSHNGDDNDENNDKPGFGALEGCSRFALSKIQDFFKKWQLLRYLSVAHDCKVSINFVIDEHACRWSVILQQDKGNS
jgi:hypothetical protein